ncbi:MAG: hypothetical protein ACRD0O_06155, partial [Acidimicrobiia bacterium]
MLLAAVAASVAVAGPGVGHAQEAEPETSSAFEVSAAAEGFRFGVGAPNYAVVTQFVDAGAPVAQALVDSIGNSRAFASNPYPGDLAITGPGTFSGLTGTPKLGDYPLYAASSYPSVPETKVSQPGYELSAVSQETASNSSAQSGGSSGDSGLGHAVVTSSASHDPDSEVLEAAAHSTVTGLEVGGVLRIGRAEAMAKVSRPLGGDLTRESSFATDAVTISGQSVVLDQSGITTPGGALPLPDSSPLLAALRQAQITVTYLRGIEDSEGVVSPGLLITQTTSIPSGPNIIVS